MMANPHCVADGTSLVGSESSATASLSQSEKDISLGLESKQHKLGLDINKPWGWSGSSYDDYDVITVHGIRDDYKTSWIDKEGVWWVKDQLFEGLAIREIDYSYETHENSTIYQSNGIGIHAEQLIRDFAKFRESLEETETDWPVIWICHDLGGIIVKAALTMAIANPSKYGKIAVLTTAIIFLGTPHRFQSFDFLEDQILRLILLPGPEIRKGVLSKAKSLAHQVNSVNQLFLATKSFDRAFIVNIFTQNVRDSYKHGDIHGNKLNDTEFENTNDLPDPQFAFPRYAYLSGHSFEASGRFSMRNMNHLDLVQGAQAESYNWVTPLKSFFHLSGSTIKVDYEFVQFQARLLSLAPPTRAIDTFFDPALPKPTVVVWIYQQAPYATFSNAGKGCKLMHIHGDGRSSFNISELSRLIYVHYDSDIMTVTDAIVPCKTVIYFEFDCWDSRYSTASSMLIYFINALVWRFNSRDFMIQELTFLDETRSWSLENLYHLFSVLRAYVPGASELTFFISCFDQCPEDQRRWFLEHVLEDQSYGEEEYRMILSTSDLDGLAVRCFPDDARINLVDCPAVSESNKRVGKLQPGLTSMIIGRPIYNEFRLQLENLLRECHDAPYLGPIILTWLGNYHRGKPKAEITDVIHKLVPVTAENIVQVFVCSLPPELRSRASHVFNWVKHASEPWSPEAMVEALAVHESHNKEPSLSDLDVEVTMRDIEAAFGGIIISKNRNIKFSHPSFYNLPEVGVGGATEEWASKVHSTMATTCLRYFQFGVVRGRLEDFCLQNLEGGPWTTPLDAAIIYHSRLSMAEYAIRFWSRHYRESGRYKPSNLVRDLFANREFRAAWQIPFWLLSNPFTRLQRSYVSILPVLATLGLQDLIEETVKSELDGPSFQKDCWFAITEAARANNEDVVQQLLRLVAVDEEELPTALFWAAANSNTAVVNALLKKIPDLTTFQWPENLIYRASASGLDNLFHAILKSGCDINKDSNFQQRPLTSTLIRFHCVSTMRIWLNSEPKPDLTVMDENGDTPITDAAKAGNPQMIDLLLQYGASINTEGNRTLEMALRSNKHKAVDLLIKANVDFVNVGLLVSDLVTPLVAAARWGFRECVLVLLDNGADPNSKCSTGSALYEAVAGNYQDVARILLEHEPKLILDVPPPNKPMLMTQAVCTGNTELVSLLLNYSVQVNFVDPNIHSFHKTPLSLACFQGKLDMVKLLLENQADINYTGDTSDSPLFTAICNWHDKVANYLLQDKSIDVSWTAGDGWNTLHAACHSPSVIRRILRMGVSVDSHCNHGTVLHLASRKDYPKSIEVLFENNPKPVLDCVVGDDGVFKDEVGCTPLQLACMHHHPECVRILQKAGANTKFRNKNGDDAVDILLRTEMNSQNAQECLKLLLPVPYSVPVDQVNEKGQTRLHSIHEKTPISIVQLLVEAGAPLDTQDHDGYTPLAIAIGKGNESVAKYLVEQGARVNVFGAEFGSILHLAIAKGHMNIVKLLVNSGANCEIVNAEYGESLLYTALGIEDDSILEKLVRYLVDEAKVPIDQLGGELAYPIIRAAEMLRTKHASGIKVLRFLIQRKAQVNVADSQGRRAVHFACTSQNDDGLKALVDAGADIETRDKLGRKPIHFAAAVSSTNCISFFLDRLHDDDTVDATDLDNWTPLLWAARSGDWDIIAKLVARGADVWACGRAYGVDSEWSALKLANFADRNPSRGSELEPQERERVNQYGVREDWDDNFHRIPAGHKKDALCKSCLVTIIGIQWKCIECTEDFSLCFKCYSHRSDVHSPEHNFDEIEPQYSENVLPDHASISSDTDE